MHCSPRQARANTKPVSICRTDDPFKGLLDSASSASAALNRQQQQRHLPLDPLTDASAALAANFTQRDVRNLLGVLQNQGLALELRRSAAEELLALSPEPQLLGVMVEPQSLEVVWGLCLPSWWVQGVVTGVLPGSKHAGSG
jgi:hypothetical protein